MGFWMMVTRRSSSSEVSSPARFFRSTSAFLQTRLAIRAQSALCPPWARGYEEVGASPEVCHEFIVRRRRTIAATDTLDFAEANISCELPRNLKRGGENSRQGVDDLLLAVNVGVEQTQNVVEAALSIPLACIPAGKFNDCPKSAPAAVHGLPGLLRRGHALTAARSLVRSKAPHRFSRPWAPYVAAGIQTPVRRPVCCCREVVCRHKLTQHPATLPVPGAIALCS